MLQIDKLEVRGFKSFSDKTTVEFTPGITAVVGPNGCGKSNIADALQWVLGEQSARALRGRRMEDVIFAGSEARGPGGMAEVTLHLVGKNGVSLPNGADRVLLTRRLFRTGESDYLIDGKPSRLSDIRALLDRVRAGRRTYGIIDQAHVASFVVSKPRERRLFIEEAAGVAGFKQRRRLSENKLEATRANLLRVDDIVREVERQMRSLKRQASFARRARKLDEKLRALRTVWYRRRERELVRQVDDLGEARAVAEREARHLEQERTRVAALLSSAREQLERGHGDRERAVEVTHAARLEEQRLEREIETARTRADALEAEAGRHDGESRRLADVKLRREEDLATLAGQRERILADVAAVETKLGESRAELDRQRDAHSGLEEQASELERAWYDRLHERAELAAQLSAARERAEREEQRAAEAVEAGRRLDASLARAGESLEAARRAAAEARDEERDAARRLEEAREQEDDAARAVETERTAVAGLAQDLGSLAGEKTALDSLDVRLAGEDPAREVLEAAARGALAARGVLADVLKVDEAIERAAEAWLGERLAAVLVDSDDDVLAAARLDVGGSVQFLPPGSPRAADGSRPLPAGIDGDPRVRGRLLASIGGEAQLLGRFDDAIVVDRLATALELRRSQPDENFVTLDGDVVAATGVVTIRGAGPSESEGLLGRVRRRDQLALALDELGARRVAALATLEAARERAQQAQAARRLLEEQVREMHRRAEATRLAVSQAEREVERLEREAALARGVLDQAESDLREVRGRSADVEKEVERAGQRIEAARSALDDGRARVRAHEAEVRDAAAILGGLMSDARAYGERRAAVDKDVARLESELDELRERSAAGGRQRDRARDQAAELRRSAEEGTKRLEACRARREQTEAEAEGWNERLAGATSLVRAAEARLDTVGEEFEGARARRETATLEAERARLALDHEREACREELGREASALPDERPEDVPDEILDTNALLREEIAQLRKRRERVGAVNPLAEREFEELSTRFDELTTQRDDLVQSIDELKDAIRRMNRESRERFLEAFTEIRRHYKEQFALLFRGGRADLILEDESDPLESGIEIMCQPPGKKLQSVSLLSGGEKALAATAVLFAIFCYQPPPFCLLDEVDAPLDDANVGRFADSLRSFTEETQIILITHNKRSMEMADMLYGVTMPEPGVSNLVAMTLD